ncbi:MAG TPA: thioesterase family protein [Polyangia bacterium]
MSFTDASAVTEVARHHYRAHVPDHWQQGRGAFGGLVLGTLLRAIEHAEPTRATRTLCGDLCGPVAPGDADIRVVELRRGSNQTNLAATLTQRDVVVATATAVLSSPRAVATPPFAPTPPPPASDWRQAPAIATERAGGPTFTRHYEYRSAAPAFARGEPLVDGFIRERVPLPRLDAPALVGRLDAWWPTLFALDGAPRPVATISFTAEILVDPATLAAAEPLRHRARLVAMHEGFFVELRELWDGERVVALNQQTFAILR